MPTPQTIQDALQLLHKELQIAHSDAPFVVARALFCHVLGVDKHYLTTHAQDPLPFEAWQKIQHLAARHKKHEPLAYILGSKEFFGRNFCVSPHTLIPRPETEDMLEVALHHLAQHTHPITFADIGTGSGCIGISLACEIPTARGILVDISAQALNIAAKNAHMLAVAPRLLCIQANLTQLPIQAQSLDLCISNPPYVSENEYANLNANVKNYEPKTALVPTTHMDQEDPLGLYHIEELAKQLHTLLKPGGIALVEHGSNQGQLVRQIFTHMHIWDEIKTYNDLAGLERFCFCKKK